MRRQQFGGRLGASSRIVNVLAQGSAKILKDMQEAEKIGAVIPEILAGSAAAFFDDSLLRLKKTIQGFARVITLSLTPQLIEIVDTFEKWIIVNKELIATRLGDFLSMVVNVLKNLKVILFAVAGIMVALTAAAIVAAGPWIAFGAAIAAILVNLDKFRDLSDSFVRLFNNIFPSSVDKTTMSIDKATNAVSKFLGVLKKLNPLNAFGSSENIPIFTLFSLGKAKRLLDEASGLIESSSVGGAGQRFPVLSGLVASAGSVNNDITINVNGAESPREVAVEVKRQFDLATAAQTASPGFNRPKVG